MAVPTQDEINRLLTAIDRAEGAADYADTIKCEAQQVDGDNYKMVWSTHYSGNFEPNK